MFLLLLACASPESSEPDCLRERARLEGEDELIYDLAWSPIDRLIFTGGSESLRLVHVDETGRFLTIWKEEQTLDARFNSVFWTQDGQYAVVPTGHSVRILQVDRERQTYDELYLGPEVPYELQRGMLSPDESLLLTCDHEGWVRLSSFSVDPPGIAELDALHAHTRCTRVSWSPSGTRASSVGLEGSLPLYAVDAQAGTLTVLSELQLSEESGEVTWTPEEDRLVAGSFGELNELWVIDIVDDSFQVVSTNTDHQSGIGALEFSASGDLLLTGDHNHTVRMYRMDDQPKLLAELPVDGHGVHSVRFSHDERFIARTPALFVDHLDILEVGACAGN